MSPELLALMRADAGRGVSRDTEDIRQPDDPELKIWCALQVIPADTDYLTWFRVGCAIYAGLGDAGFELFDDWSREAPHKYPKNGCAEKWRECAKTTAIGVDTLYWLADNEDREWRAAYRVLLSRENA
jgi:putative DNA primase/helicase